MGLFRNVRKSNNDWNNSLKAEDMLDVFEDITDDAFSSINSILMDGEALESFDSDYEREMESVFSELSVLNRVFSINDMPGMTEESAHHAGGITFEDVFD